MIQDQIVVNNIKCKLIFLFKGAKNTEVKAIPVRYRRELKQLFDELQEYISPEEYEKFLADCLGIELMNPVKQDEDIELKGPVEQAENIIRKKSS